MIRGQFVELADKIYTRQCWIPGWLDGVVKEGTWECESGGFETFFSSQRHVQITIFVEWFDGSASIGIYNPRMSYFSSNSEKHSLNATEENNCFKWNTIQDDKMKINLC